MIEALDHILREVLSDYHVQGDIGPYKSIWDKGDWVVRDNRTIWCGDIWLSDDGTSLHICKFSYHHEVHLCDPKCFDQLLNHIQQINQDYIQQQNQP